MLTMLIQEKDIAAFSNSPELKTTQKAITI